MSTRLYVRDSLWFLTHMKKNVSLCNDQRWADWLIVRRDKIFNVAIFWDTTDMLNVKLCTMVGLLLNELYLFILLSGSWPYFKVIGVSNSFNRDILCSCPVKLILHGIGKYRQVEHKYVTFCDSRTYSREITDIFPPLKNKQTNKSLNIYFFRGHH